jgi:diaminopropionate ammonia-lyase
MRVLLRQATPLAEVTPTGRPLDFHRRLPGYAVTALVDAPLLASRLGVGQVLIKDETRRFGLPSFKILGASWATYATLRERLGPLPDGTLTLQDLRSWARPARPLTLIAATDGNHGRAVACVAAWFGHSARIYIPNFVSEARRRAIQNQGAELVVIDGNYDAAVEAALDASQQPGVLLISDTGRVSSDPMSLLVTAGYTTAFLEAEEQLRRSGEDSIDAIGVQAGVGGLASAATLWARQIRLTRPSHVIVTEPENAACVFTALAAGEPAVVSASRDTAMAVLQCGTVSQSAFPTLNAGVSCCLAIEDEWALAAVAELRTSGVKTGPSGAAGLAGIMAAFDGTFAAPVKQHLGLGPRSRLLFVTTESPEALGHEAAGGMAE